MKVIGGFLSICGIVCAFLLAGCSPKTADILVLQVGPSKVDLEDYQNFYLKNSGNMETARASSQQERERFLDLLTNYKLKLQDAYDRGILNDSDIQRELAEYRASLASSYQLEHDVTEPGIRQLYERRKVNIRAKHILISLKPEASPADTQKAYARALDVIRQARAGVPFDTLVMRYSEDPSARANGGDLYYFTGGVMVKAFEDAVYGMKVGEMSALPTRSNFGYHIIKVFDIEPARMIRVRHLMARFESTTPDSADSAKALARIRGMQDSLKKGWDFSKLAIKLSEDGGSAQQGGALPWFERRRFVEPFEDAAFKLKVGELSGIVRSPFGFHLILLDSVREQEPYAAMHEDLKTLYQKNRYQEDYALYIAGLKKEYGFSFDEDVFRKFVGQLDSTKTTEDSAWDAGVSPDVRKLVLMTVGNKPFTVDSLLVSAPKRPDLRDTPLRLNDLRPKLDRIGGDLLIDIRAAGLEQRSPEFAQLMKEYTDGVILYKAEQMEVWGKTVVTDSILRQYYENNKTQFMFPERVNINQMMFESDTTALMIYDSLTHGADFSDLAGRWNDDAKLRGDKGARGFQIIDADAATKRAAKLKKGEFSEPVELERGGYAIVQLVGVDPPRQKTYEQAGAEISNAYQEYESKRLEQQWLERLRQKYPVVQYKENLKRAFESQ
ncbi:MAG TPA: peptidylprolyl isomerase [Bacteroidota bacterium]|nr:peptidylprolyl isomerase [Bacteroidota bacterium]